jgi:peptide deformylase
MTVREVLFYPEERDVLTTECEPVEDVDDDIRELVDDLIETMYAANGVGLAAPQIGVLKRITVIDVSHPDADERDPIVLINPEIIEKSGSLKWEEGCLSFPGLYGDVKRAAEVKVRALDRDGEEYEIEGEELLAVALQHEIDHLDGILFIDHMSGLKRRMALKKYKKLRAQMEEEAAKEAEEAAQVADAE